MTQSFQRGVLIAGVSLLLAGVACCGYKVHTLSAAQESIKQDYSIANNISFGLLSVNKWRDLVVSAVTHEIQDFNLTPAQQDSLEKEVEQILYSLVDKADSLMDAPQKSLGGKLKQLALHAFVKKDELHRLVPAFARKITRGLLKPSSKEKLEYLAKSKLEDLEQDTYDSSKQAEATTVDSIYRKYRVSNETEFEKDTGAALAKIRHTTYAYSFGMLGGVLLILLLWYLLRKNPPLHTPLYILSILMALILLLVGLTTTMIEIDARIKSLNFQLIGQTISFKNQVLFFQSKSIVDVVKILVDTGKYDSILVGMLILCFSIFFPIAKLLSTGIYLLSQKKWAKNKVVHYFAFYSGKWSMADVTVVAIFMAYIGFNGILNSQLADLNFRSDEISSIATNQTSLQPGYIIFVGFVLFGLVLSQILKNITHEGAGPSSTAKNARPAKAPGSSPTR